MDGLLFVLILEVVLLQMRILERSDSLGSHRTSKLEKMVKLERNKVLRHRCVNFANQHLGRVVNYALPSLSREDLFPAVGCKIGCYFTFLHELLLIQHFRRTLVKDILRRTLIEIAEEGHAYTLYQAVDILSQSATSLKTVQLENDQLKRLLENTKNELLTKRYHRCQQLNKYDETVALLKDEIRDSQINSKAQLCYVDKWLCASTNALQYRHKIKPVSLPSPDHEQRVHDEILRAYELQIKEREELVQYWKSKYRDDIMKISDHVIEQSEMLKVTIIRREELTKLYDYHAGEMRAWLTFKRERAARLAREQRSRLAATRIQAWWRGVMVRRALGAFKHLRNSKKSVTKTKKK